MSRHYRYLVIPGVSFAADVDGGQARLAVTFCDEQDQFSRKTAKVILDHLLDSDNNTLQALRLTRNVFTMPFRGPKKVGRELMQPLIEALTDRLNERTLYRGLRALFLEGLTTEDAARAAAKEAKNENIFKAFSRYTNVLEKDEKEVFGWLSTLEEFETAFFDWAGSANAIIDGLEDFAYQAQQADLEESAQRIREALSKDAPEESEKPADSDETQRLPVMETPSNDEPDDTAESETPPPLPQTAETAAAKE